MSDFLLSLAARSLGAEPSVAPRRASRFEGAGEPALPAPAEPAAPSFTAEPPPPPHPQAAARSGDAMPPAPPRPFAPEPGRQGWMTDVDEPGPALVPRQPPREREQPPLPSLREPRDAADAEPLRPAPTSASRSDAAPRESEPVRRVDGARPASPEPVRPAAESTPRSVEARRPPFIQPVELDAVQPVRPAREQAPPPLRAVDVPVEARARREERDAPLPLVTPRAERMPIVVQRPAAAAAAAPIAAAADPPAPVIRVSIGRIEVRAAQPAAAPPPLRVASAPRQSLDDYLRSGARRRP